MNYSALKEYICSNEFTDKIIELTAIKKDQKARYLALLDKAYELYGDGDYHFASSPGRSEIGGNHTDHQHGKVVAAALNIDDLCIFKANDHNTVNYYDTKLGDVNTSLDDLSLDSNQFNTSASLIKGVAAYFVNNGYKIGGFDAVCDANVLIGSGISSSACFEVLLAEVFNYLYNDSSVSSTVKAIGAQYAENVYFGKPSGLMDQMAIATGGFVAIDFFDPVDPKVRNYDFSFDDYAYNLFLVNTKGDHANLTHEYAAIPNEIREVAHRLDVEYLADSSLDKLVDNLCAIRKDVNNDRGILRSIHFYLENERAGKLACAIDKKDIDEVLKLMNESGHSSFEYLQNVYPASRVNSQSLALGLALCTMILADTGAKRVHGGGFEGTIQVVVPDNKLDDFKKIITKVFGEDSLMQVAIRQKGTCTLI